MKVSGKGVVTQNYKNDKGNQYLTLVDLGNGGEVKISMGSANVEVKSGDMVAFDLDVKGQTFIGKEGSRSYSLIYQNGTFKKEGG